VKTPSEKPKQKQNKNENKHHIEKRTKNKVNVNKSFPRPTDEAHLVPSHVSMALVKIIRLINFRRISGLAPETFLAICYQMI
jgi:hypothetical protein